MLILSDTCFWTHSIRIFQEKILDVRPILLNFDLYTTDRVLEEVYNYKLENFVPLNETTIIPIFDEDFGEYPELSGMDIQDGSLVIAYDQIENEDPLILTDDGELYEECIQTNRDVFLLPLFLLFMVEKKYLSKKKMAQCLRFWEKNGKYKKRDIKKWKLELQMIN